MRAYVIADYQELPAEGMQVISKTLIDALRIAGHEVSVLPPKRARRGLPGLIARRPRFVVFTHGPGRGTVIASIFLRTFTRAKVIWVCTRPDVKDVPRILKGRRTAHVVICNRRRSDLERVAVGASIWEQYIGIDPSRLISTDQHPWPELQGAPVVLHVGHLRESRGLDLLAQAKRRLGDRAHVVVQGSPTFPPDVGVVEQLQDAGVVVRRNFISNLADLYSAADLYVFPARPENEGATELPLGVLEAVACGVPVVTNDFGAISGALGGVAGVTIVRPSAFAEAVQQFIEGLPTSRVRPPGLPYELHASRISDVVLELLDELR